MPWLKVFESGSEGLSLQGPVALQEAAACGAERAAAIVRRLLADAAGAQLVLLPVLMGGSYDEPLSTRLEYPNRCARLQSRTNRPHACSLGLLTPQPEELSRLGDYLVT